MSRQKLGSRSARFEALEKKEMLAGDVLVSVVRGDLKLEGDALDNQVAITAGAEAGTFLITGLDGTNLRLVDRLTGLPGDPVAELEVAARGDVKVDLGDEDDLLAVANASVRGKLHVEMGLGDDEVHVGTAAAAELVGGDALDDASVSARGGLKIDLGDGEDTADVGDVSVRGLLKINAGAGDDELMLGAALNGEVGAALNGSNGGANGNGALLDALLNVRSNIELNLGDGDDVLNLGDVGVHGSAVVQAGAGADTIGVNGAAMAHALVILGGQGEDTDTVNVNGASANYLGIHTGDGDDDVSVQDSVFSLLGISLGDGDDLLATGELEARLAVLLGGDGEDTHDELAPSDLVNDLINGFELPLPLVENVVDDLPFGRFLGRNLFGSVDRLLDRVSDKLESVDSLLERVGDGVPSVERLVPDTSLRGRGRFSFGFC